MRVNRQLTCQHFDHIDHALGRPVDPMADSHRNHFATAEGALAAGFRASPHWHHDGAMGGMLCFSVTTEGRKALRQHLREIGDRHRLYTVSWGGFDMAQIATSRSKARYAKYLDVSDSAPDLTFKAFAASARVRLAPRA